MNYVQQRITKELKNCLTDESLNIEYELNIFEWIVKYETFTFKLIIPSNYPFSSPKVVFLNGVKHPNIDYESGKLCMGLLDQWSPKYSLSMLINSIKNILQEPI